MSGSKRVQQWATFGRIWYLFDCKWQNPFESAEKIVTILSGANKPIFHPLSDCGDHVVAINSRHIALPGTEWERRVYFHHTGYPSGATWTLAHQLHKKDPTLILWKAVYKQIGNNLLRRGRMAKLHIFPEDEVPDTILENLSAQLGRFRPVPKRLQDLNVEEVEQFPKVFDWPKNFIVR